MIGNIALMICALFVAARGYRVGGEHYTSGFVISLSSVFIAASAAGNLLLSGALDQDQQTLLRMLNNLAYYAAIPLIGTALLADAIGQNWQKPTWGRWLLALLALFEITRRAESGTEYSQIMAVLVAASMLFAALRYSRLPARIGSLFAAIALGAGVLLFSPISLSPEYQNALAYPLALAIMLLASAQVLPRLKPGN